MGKDRVTQLEMGVTSCVTLQLSHLAHLKLNGTVLPSKRIHTEPPWLGRVWVPTQAWVPWMGCPWDV